MKKLKTNVFCTNLPFTIAIFNLKIKPVILTLNKVITTFECTFQKKQIIEQIKMNVKYKINHYKTL